MLKRCGAGATLACSIRRRTLCAVCRVRTIETRQRSKKIYLGGVASAATLFISQSFFPSFFKTFFQPPFLRLWEPKWSPKGTLKTTKISKNAVWSSLCTPPQEVRKKMWLPALSAPPPVSPRHNKNNCFWCFSIFTLGPTTPAKWAPKWSFGAPLGAPFAKNAPKSAVQKNTKI